MTTRLHGWNRSGKPVRILRLALLGSPVVALSLVDSRLGLAGLVGAGVTFIALTRDPSRRLDQVPSPDFAPALPTAENDEDLHASQTRERMREIEIEALEGELFDLELRLREARMETTELLGLFDATEHPDPQTWLRRLQDQLRLRGAAAQPTEPVALADVIVERCARVGWHAGDVTIADSLPVILAPRPLVEQLIVLVFESWEPLGPVIVHGQMDGAMAMISIHGLGLERWSHHGPVEATSQVLDLMGGALIPDAEGIAFALPIAGTH